MAEKVPQLDVNQNIVQIKQAMEQEIEQNGVPSPYFEDLWYVLVKYLEDVDARLTAGGL